MDGKRSTLWFAIFTCVVLLSGAAGGVLVDRQLIRHRPPGPAADGMLPVGGMRPGMMPGGGMRAGQPGGMVPHLRRVLGLSPEQVTELDKILERRRQQIETVRREMREKMEAEQRALHDEIRGILQPDQRKRFDELLASSPGPWPGPRGGVLGHGRGMPGGRGDGRGEW